MVELGGKGEEKEEHKATRNLVGFVCSVHRNLCQETSDFLKRERERERGGGGGRQAETKTETDR